MQMKGAGMIATLMAANLLPIDIWDRKYPKEPKKNCLNCGNPHEHNNSFCSATCCKDFNHKEVIL